MTQVIDCAQRSDEWLDERLGVITASQMHRIRRPTGGFSDERIGYIYELIAEWISGKPLTKQGGYRSRAMQTGSEREPLAAETSPAAHARSIRSVSRPQGRREPRRQSCFCWFPSRIARGHGGTAMSPRAQ